MTDIPRDSEVLDGSISANCGFLLMGSPGSGKSAFIRSFLDEKTNLLSEPLDYVVIFYGERSQFIKDLEKEISGVKRQDEIILVAGLPEDLTEYIRDDRKNLFIFDDLQEVVSSSEQVLDLVTKKFQHRSVSWMIVFQNAFHQAVHRVSITRAATHIVIFNSPLDKSVPYILASRLMPESRKTFIEIYKHATKQPYTYLLCDGSQTTPNVIRLRSDIFGGKQIVYTPKT